MRASSSLVRSILVLRGGALGDFIVTLPALVALKRQWPDARIEFVGNATAAELARNRGLVAGVHSQHDSKWAALHLAQPLPRAFADWLREFDLIISFWPDPDGALAAHFPLRPDQQFIAAPAMPARAPAAAHYCAALLSLGVGTDEYFSRITAVSTAPRQTIAIHPGSGSPKKNWPAERWIQLMTELPSPLLVVIGEAEARTWSESRLRATRLGPRLHDGSLAVAVSLPLEELITRFGCCRLFLGHDSGMSHLAAACGVPCVLLFGPTDPAMWAPPAPHVRVIRHGSDLMGISVDEVHAAVETMTERPPAAAKPDVG